MTSKLSINHDAEFCRLDDGDFGLFLALKALRDCWWETNVGVVSACLLTPKHDPVCATSTLNEDGKWIHAERNVLQMASQVEVRPVHESVLAVTLSPCITPSSSARVGGPCIDIIREFGLSRVHFGAEDPAQKMNWNRTSDLRLGSTKNPLLRTICTNLLCVLQDLPQDKSSLLTTIKAGYGDGVFLPLEELIASRFVD